MMELLSQTWAIALLIFGFGFVVFFHELGHFLAAKYVGIRVEQFAVGFGQALFSWRQGLGFRLGSSAKEYQARRENATGGQLGETEYRINWIPLGGYVKMLGQDDMKPGATADDPRAFNRKSIGARMLVVSAGVIMNVILAAIGFMVLFLMGYNAPPPVVGAVVPGSPAALAGLHVGDRVLYFNDKWQHDFTKIALNVALVPAGEPIPVYIRTPEGREMSRTIMPQRRKGDSMSLLSLGIGKPVSLAAATEKEGTLPEEARSPKYYPAQTLSIAPGDVIVSVNQQPVKINEYYKLDRALQSSDGKPVTIGIRAADGKLRQEELTPRLEAGFEGGFDLAGLIPRPMIHMVPPDSPAAGKLMPDDVILAIATAGGEDRRTDPTFDEFVQYTNAAGEQGQPVSITVLREGKSVGPISVAPTVKLRNGRWGFDMAMDWYDPAAIVAGTASGSPAELAGIPKGTKITSANDQPVNSWFDLRNILQKQSPGQAISLTGQSESGEQRFSLKLNQQQLSEIAALRYANPLMISEMASLLKDQIEPRKTSNPLEAAAWGVTETREMILQFYVTISRMFQGSVSYKNMMGPVGIVKAGAHFAFRGTDWLIWFLAMISANLAVVNFLPIPVVDGGLFLFLILEKIQGRPLSQRAQSIAQVIGLALILGVFLLVTYQDIVRH